MSLTWLTHWTAVDWATAVYCLFRQWVVQIRPCFHVVFQKMCVFVAGWKWINLKWFQRGNPTSQETPLAMLNSQRGMGVHEFRRIWLPMWMNMMNTANVCWLLFLFYQWTAKRQAPHCAAARHWLYVTVVVEHVNFGTHVSNQSKSMCRDFQPICCVVDF